jgi:hypothetical protein
VWVEAVAGGSHDSSNLSTILTLDERKITIKLIFIKNTPRVVDLPIVHVEVQKGKGCVKLVCSIEKTIL